MHNGQQEERNKSGTPNSCATSLVEDLYSSKITLELHTALICHQITCLLPVKTFSEDNRCKMKGFVFFKICIIMCR
jgi:hypothetical protein